MRQILTRLIFYSSLRRKVYLRLANQLKYNVSLLLALEAIYKQQVKRNNTLLVKMFSHIIEEDKVGKKISSALIFYIPSDELMLIQAGEKSGNLQEGFLLAAKIIEAKKNIHTAIRNAIAYPILLILMIITLLIVISLVVIPNFALVSDPKLWTGSAYVLYVTSNVVASPFGIMLAFCLLAGIAIFLYSLPNFTGTLRVKLDKYPPYSFYRLTVGATWLFTVASLIKAGMLVSDILKDMYNSKNNSLYLKERLTAIMQNSAGGKKFGEALALTHTNFPDEDIVDDIKAYSDLPNIEETLYQVAEDWLIEGVNKIKDNAKIFNTVCLFTITFLIATIVVAFQNIQAIMLQGV